MVIKETPIFINVVFDREKVSFYLRADKEDKMGFDWLESRMVSASGAVKSLHEKHSKDKMSPYIADRILGALAAIFADSKVQFRRMTGEGEWYVPW